MRTRIQFRMALLAIMAMLITTGCIGALRRTGTVPTPGNSRTSDSAQQEQPVTFTVPPASIEMYQGSVIALDGRGGGGAPIGLAAAKHAGLTDAYVPMDQTGFFNDEGTGRNYIQDIMDSTGARIGRASVTRYDAGRPGNLWGQVNFGKVLMDFQSAADPGEFLGAWADSLKSPIAGVAFDAEYSIMDQTLYPLTAEDRANAALWGYDFSGDVNRDEYIRFRDRQVATWIRLSYHLSQQKFPTSQKLSVFSGYPKLNWSAEGEVSATYGVDWDMMADSTLSWRGITLPAVTHAMLVWNSDVALPQPAREWVATAPFHLLHVLQFAPNYAGDPANWNTLIKDRLSLLRSNKGDGIAIVNLLDGEEGISAPHVFSASDTLLFQALGDTLREHKLIKDDAQ